LSVGGRRNGTHKFGHGGTPSGRHTGHYAGRHAVTRRKPARWAGKAAPAAAIAATLAAGAAAYGFTSQHAEADPAKLTAALSAPIVLNAITKTGVGKVADAAAHHLLAPSPSPAADGAAPNAAPGAPAAKPAESATAQPSASVTGHSPSAQPSQASAAPAPTAAPSPSASQTSAAATTVSCSNNSYLLPANVTAIVNFLLANGYSHNAVAGMAGNIYQESKGDPESIGMGGGGLIGWTPLPSGFVTGNPSADLQTQLAAILTYNNGWSAYVPALNSAATPADAAYIYVTDFERAGIPATSTREASADAVASACGL